MERKSFLFYESFYLAVKDLPKDVQLEVYTAIIRYALYGEEPVSPRPFTASIFALVKPNIDSYTLRVSNGQKGGRRRKDIDVVGNNSTTDTAPSPQPYTATFADEVARMKTDTDWITSAVCKNYSIPAAEAISRLDQFLCHCETECVGKPHSNYDDARRHFCSWMRKACTAEAITPPSATPAATKCKSGRKAYEERKARERDERDAMYQQKRPTPDEINSIIARHSRPAPDNSQ